MYIPKNHLNENKAELLAFIRNNGFGILVSQVEGKPWATHIPMYLSDDGKTLTSHMSRGNAQWKSLVNQNEVLAIFQGPHAYISSSWYDHENVPTWNYIAVHVYGTVRLIEGEELIDSLKKLVNKYEKHSNQPVTVEGMSETFLQHEIRGIVAFELNIKRMEAAYKLSQNRDGKNHTEIIRQLEKRGDNDSIKMAEEMRKRKNLIR
ncbi:MAG: FMN-binding negative transcriptional regulator [Bacteroidota bacterium]|jgi:transcriptional regulator|nr:FMN-binding negative transcriptional regulator [Cytophagales bacterium]MCE2957126.1 FMN-binding negative transcriptional regulator [Flammeovirgaceae bacterium]MCZ8070460.1 FMN-binding negative transcriptional regulator [Cytophagales bacterium]